MGSCYILTEARSCPEASSTSIESISSATVQSFCEILAPEADIQPLLLLAYAHSSPGGPFLHATAIARGISIEFEINETSLRLRARATAPVYDPPVKFDLSFIFHIDDDLAERDAFIEREPGSGQVYRPTSVHMAPLASLTMAAAPLHKRVRSSPLLGSEYSADSALNLSLLHDHIGHNIALGVGQSPNGLFIGRIAPH